jgi:glycosyltransferase involved in cell wall biosynthesis
MNDAPKVSVLLPVYRNPRTVRRAMRSILQQSLRDLELIVVENGSDPETKAAIRSLRDPRIRLLSRDEPGIVPAMNHGLEHARGKYLARMDADDFSHPMRLELQAAALDRSPRLDLVSSLVRFRSHLSSQGFARYVDWQNGLVRHRDIVLGQFIESPLVHPSVMFRTNLARELGGYRDGDFPEDYDLWLRMLEHGARMRKLPRTLLVWRDHTGRLTRNDERYYEQAFHALKAPYIARFIKPRLNTGRKLIIWGAGKLSRRFAPLLLKHGVEYAGWIDIDPRKIGRELKGHEIFAPDALQAGGNLFPNRQARPFVVSYVAGAEARRLIGARLNEYGYRNGQDFLMAA